MIRTANSLHVGVSIRAIVIAGMLACGAVSAEAQTANDGVSGAQSVPPKPVDEQAISAPLGASPAEEAQQPDDALPGDARDIVVTGFRASLESALALKRQSNQIIDAITAEDIANFPDANLAESIQRLPGISIDRDNGEGRTITVRGLGGDFQVVRLNGVDAQSVAGSNDSGSGANRTRGFDFNTFASELFGGVKITKSTSAANDEGSLGAIIDLTTGRPLAYKKDRLAVGLEGEYRENGKTVNPRLTGLASVHVTDTFGLLGSIAYQHQRQQIDSYRRSGGQSDITYRNSQINGVTPPTFGFARPSNQGTGATFGSDPAAYALVTPTTIIPALPSISRQQLDYERLGATATAQWRPTSHTEITIDGVYSKYDQDSTVDGITTIGLNRNGTNTRVTQNTLRAVNTANGLADRVALYQRCVPSATADCGGTTLLPGYRDSYNPNNLNPFDYYNNPASPGYIATANQTGGYDALIGRPNTKLVQASVNSANQADYLVLDDVDWRSSADAQFGTTKFYQGTINLTQDITNAFRMDAVAGYSKSEFLATGLLAEFNTLDRDGYTFDERNSAKFPVFNPGFDVADPNSWTLVKGLSTIRYFNNIVDNEYRVGRINFALDLNPEVTLRFGGTYKQYDFDSDQGRRNQDFEAVNPTLAEAGLQITDLGQTVGFGDGIDVPQGTPTSFYAPDLNKFISQFGIDCNCVNKYGDFRAVVDGRQRNSVTEKDLAGYFQLDFNSELFGHSFRGDAGLRVARTRVSGRGSVGATDGVLGLPVSAKNEYTDYLPSLNLVYEPVRDLLVRFATAKVIARPLLGNLTPGTTSFASGLSSSGAAPAVTVGNPYLKPFRAFNLDLGVEKYFGRGGIVAVNLFLKDLDSFPQQIASEAPLSAVFAPDIYNQVVANFTSPTLLAYTQAGGVYAVRQYQDAPGGTIKGIEVNVQSNFTFLPAPFDNFGVTANYTHIDSKLTYLTGTTLATVRAGGPRPLTTASRLRRSSTPPPMRSTRRCITRTSAFRSAPRAPIGRATSTNSRSPTAPVRSGRQPTAARCAIRP